jgi:fibronectin type 3 domain-containing protein
MLFGWLVLSLAFGAASDVMSAGRALAPRALKLSVVEAAPAPQVGSVPVGLPNGTAHSTGLIWTPGAPVTGLTVSGYNIYRSTTANGEGGSFALNGSTLVTTTSYTDTSVVPGTTYFYVVAAQSSNGNQSGFSNEATSVIPNNPSNPSGCKASGS